LRDEEGNVTHVLETVRDVTDLVRAEKGLWRSQRLASIGRLAAEIAHEMNNPLTSILTFSKLAISILEEDPPPTHRLAELQKYLSYLMSETERCVNISRGLLDFSRQSEIQIVENDVHEILERTLDILRHRAGQDEIEIQTAFSTNIPPLSCDFRRLQQAFMNVLWNAIEAMPEGGVLTVSTSFDPKQDQIEITIADTGAGIPEDDVERIFEPFFTTKADGKGVGLGLSVAYGIISQHRGEIHVQSKVGEGTHFTIQLSPGSNDVSVEDEKDDIILFKR
jgi:signal transduction histidine kinase